MKFSFNHGLGRLFLGGGGTSGNSNEPERGHTFRYLRIDGIAFDGIEGTRRFEVIARLRGNLRKKKNRSICLISVQSLEKNTCIFMGSPVLSISPAVSTVSPKTE